MGRILPGKRTGVMWHSDMDLCAWFTYAPDLFQNNNWVAQVLKHMAHVDFIGVISGKRVWVLIQIMHNVNTGQWTNINAYGALNLAHSATDIDDDHQSDSPWDNRRPLQ